MADPPDSPQLDRLRSEALEAALGLTSGESALAEALRELERGRSGSTERRLERELHALIAVATSVAGAHRLEEVVEVAADRACDAIEAASLSISRWEGDGLVLRTLVNAGDLGPGEHRLPTDEIYRLEDDSVLRELLERGRPHLASVDDPDCVPQERDLLRSLGKHHSIAVPISFGGTPWGELWGTRHAHQPPFEQRDVRFLQTISGQIAAAVGRAEVFSRMAELAFKDPLTGIANRRALDERLEHSLAEALAEGHDLAVLLCDLDELKELNDSDGHAAGDAALARVAAMLREVAAPYPRSLVARVGGDEFCVVLEQATASDALDMGERLIARLGAGGGRRLSVSCGVSSAGLGARRAGDLLRAADAAQYTAKRAGRARVCVADAQVEDAWVAARTERRAIRGREATADVDVAAVLHDALAHLDRTLAERPALDRAEAVAMAVAEAIDASATSVSWMPPGSGRLETVFLHDRRFALTSGHRFGSEGSSYDVSAYPQTRAILERGGAFVVHADDPDADPAERELLSQWGMRDVLAAGITGKASGGWLVELYGDAATAPLECVEDALRLLLAEAIRGAHPVPLRAVS